MQNGNSDYPVLLLVPEVYVHVRGDDSWGKTPDLAITRERGTGTHPRVKVGLLDTYS